MCIDGDRKNKRIYVMEKASDLVKIGVSSNPIARKAQLEQEKEMKRMYYSGLISNPFVVEKKIHCCIASSKIKGEWFALSFDKAVPIVKSIVRKFSDSKPHIKKEIDSVWMENIIRAFWFPELQPDKKECILDLSRWVPKKEEEEVIRQFIQRNYEEVMEDTEDEEICRNDLELLDLIDKQGIKRSREKIQDYFKEFYWAVDGNVYKYYAKENELLSLMELTILAK